MRRIIADHFRRKRPCQWPETLREVTDYRDQRTSEVERSDILQALTEAFERLDAIDPPAASAFSLCLCHSINVPSFEGLLKLVGEYNGDHLPMRDAAEIVETSAAGMCRAMDRATTFLRRELREHTDWSES